MKERIKDIPKYLHPEWFRRAVYVFSCGHRLQTVTLKRFYGEKLAYVRTVPCPECQEKQA